MKLQDGDIFSVITSYTCPTHGPTCTGDFGDECLHSEGAQTGLSFKVSLQQTLAPVSPSLLHAKRPENPTLRDDPLSPKARTDAGGPRPRASTPFPPETTSRVDNEHSSSTPLQTPPFAEGSGESENADRKPSTQKADGQEWEADTVAAQDRAQPSGGLSIPPPPPPPLHRPLQPLDVLASTSTWSIPRDSAACNGTGHHKPPAPPVIHLPRPARPVPWW